MTDKNNTMYNNTTIFTNLINQKARYDPTPNGLLILLRKGRNM